MTVATRQQPIRQHSQEKPAGQEEEEEVVVVVVRGEEGRFPPVPAALTAVAAPGAVYQKAMPGGGLQAWVG